MKPEIPLTDKRFVYTRSESTDIRKTFQRIQQCLDDAETPSQQSDGGSTSTRKSPKKLKSS